MRSSGFSPMRIDAHSPGGDAGESGLLLLQAWLSPAFPVGGYSYSHGLEYAVEAGALNNRAALQNWIEGILLFGAGRTDALLIREIHRAVTAQEFERCDEIAAFAAAFRGTSELALEASAQGAAFLKALLAGWPELVAAEPLRQWKRPVYAVAFGAAAAVAGIAVRSAIVTYLHAFCSNLISAALRLMPIGQSDGLVCLAGLSKTLPSLADALELVPFDDIGAAALMVDFCSMRHETQYTRLFRS
jgi:urease accessory protein